MMSNRHVVSSLALNRLAMSVCVLIVSMLASSCGTASNTKVAVEVVPAKVSFKHSEIDGAKASKQASNHDVAQTDWLFSITPELDFSIKDEKKKDNQYCIGLEITAVRIKLALPIDVSIAKDAPAWVKEHENGHVEICRTVYKNARECATAAANGILNKRFEGVGADKKLALSNALQIAAQEVAAPYRGNVGSEADAVSSRYDQLCETAEYQGKVQKAIADAFAQVKSEKEKQAATK